MKSRKIQAVVGVLLMLLPLSSNGIPEAIKTVLYVVVGFTLLINALRREN
jgi:hypothetical protein